MEHILHERQEGFLCAQHCLNALLQGSYFTPVDLASLGQRMDDEERIRMAECGEESEEYKKFIKQPSGNMDDSGFFSVQVISSALEVWGLELVPYSSSDPIAVAARTNPEEMQAFICNFKQHWITIRKLGNQWFNLNSLLTGPELLSNTYLAMFLAQLRNDGYSIFIVIGNLPYSEADDLLKETPAVQHEKPRFINTNRGTATSSTSSQNRSGSQNKSVGESTNRNSVASDEEADIQRALNLSLGLDEFGKPLPSPSSPLKEIASSSGNQSLNPANQSSQMKLQPSQTSQSSCSTSNSSNVQSCTPLTRIIPVTLEYERDEACNVSISREDSMDELQSAIRLSMEPFLTEATNPVTEQQASTTSSQ